MEVSKTIENNIELCREIICFLDEYLLATKHIIQSQKCEQVNRIDICLS